METMLAIVDSSYGSFLFSNLFWCVTRWTAARTATAAQVSLQRLQRDPLSPFQSQRTDLSESFSEITHQRPSSARGTATIPVLGKHLASFCSFVLYHLILVGSWPPPTLEGASTDSAHLWAGRCSWQKGHRNAIALRPDPHQMTAHSERI